MADKDLVVIQSIGNILTEKIISSSPSKAVVFDANGILNTGNALTLGAKEFHGFENRTDSTLSMNGNQFQISGASYNIWQEGTKFVKTGVLSGAISNDKTQHFVTFDISGNLQISTTVWDLLTGTSSPVATVWKDGSAYMVTDERHSYKRNRPLHNYLHKSVSTRYGAGLVGVFSATGMSVSQGTIFDEDIEFDTLSTRTGCRIWYRDTGLATMRMEDGPQLPFKQNSGTLQYDNSGVLTNTTPNQRVCSYVFATSDSVYPIQVVVGQNAHGTLSDAQNEPLPSILINTAEWKLIYKIIYQNVGGTVTYVESSDYRTVSTGPASSPSPSSHSALTDRDTANSHPATAISVTQTSVVLGRTGAGAGAVEELPIGYFYPSSNPSGYVTTGQTGSFATTGFVDANYYPRSNPSGYITGVTGAGDVFSSGNNTFSGTNRFTNSISITGTLAIQSGASETAIIIGQPTNLNTQVRGTQCIEICTAHPDPDRAALGAYSILATQNGWTKSDYAVAIGYGASVGTGSSYGAAFGAGARANSPQSIVLGYNSIANVGSDASVVVGPTCTSSAGNSVVIGQGASVGVAAGTSVAIGYTTTSNGGLSVSIGRACTANGGAATSMGFSCAAGGANAIAIGNAASSIASNGVSIGYNAINSGSDGVAIGSNISIGVDNNGGQCIGIGATVFSSGNQAIAIGNNVKASGARAIVIGGNTSTVTSDSTVVGSANTFGTSPLIFGNSNIAAGSNGSAIFGVSNSISNGGIANIFGNSNALASTSSSNYVFGLSNSNASNSNTSCMIGFNNHQRYTYQFTLGFYNRNGSASSAQVWSLGACNNQSGKYINNADGYILGATSDISIGKISMALGFQNNNIGDWTFGAGYLNTNNNTSGYCFGTQNITSNTRSMAIGYELTNSTTNSVEIGPDNLHKLSINSSGLTYSGQQIPYITISNDLAGTSIVDWALASNVFYTTLTGNTSFSFSNSGDGRSVVMKITNTGGYSVTWPSGILWMGGSGSGITPTGTDLYTFMNIGGTLLASSNKNYL